MIIRWTINQSIIEKYEDRPDDLNDVSFGGLCRLVHTGGGLTARLDAED